MSKNSQSQKRENSCLTITAKPVLAARSGKATGIGSGGKKVSSLSKSDRVLALLRQASGVTLDELMKATKWQAHSVRGFLSAAVRKRKGLTVVSECDGAGTRRYRIEEQRSA